VTLDETYSRTLNAISPTHKPYATKMLQVLTFSKRSFTVKEIVDAIEVDTEREPHFHLGRSMPDHREVLCFCSSSAILVSTSADLTVQLSHFSVKEYLISDRLFEIIGKQIQMNTTNAYIASVYVVYLLHVKRERRVEEITAKFPLARYMAKYWMSHTVEAEDNVENSIWVDNRDMISRGSLFNDAALKDLHRVLKLLS
jgi:hypothetical protein